MARKLKDQGGGEDQPAPKDHNSRKALTREEKAALLNHHIHKLRQYAAAVETARAPFKEAQDELTNAFHRAKADLGKSYPRKYLQSLMEDVGARLRNIAAEETQRFQDRIALGLPVYGRQQDLFEGMTTDTERDATAAEHDGYLAGRRGDDATVPGDFSIFHQEWMGGWNRGQAEIAAEMGRAETILAARAAPEPDDEEGDDEPEPTLAEEAAAERKAVRRAKESLDALNGAEAA